MTYFRYEPPKAERSDLIRWFAWAKISTISPLLPPRKFNTSRYFQRGEFPTWEISTDQRLINNFGNLVKLSRSNHSISRFPVSFIKNGDLLFVEIKDFKIAIIICYFIILNDFIFYCYAKHEGIRCRSNQGWIRVR